MHPDLSKAPGAISYAQASTSRPLSVAPATERPRPLGFAGTTQLSLNKHKGDLLFSTLRAAVPAERRSRKTQHGVLLDGPQNARALSHPFVLQAVSEPAEAAESHASKSAEATKEAAGEAKEVSTGMCHTLCCMLHRASASCMLHRVPCVLHVACARSLCKPPALPGLDRRACGAAPS